MKIKELNRLSTEPHKWLILIRSEGITNFLHIHMMGRHLRLVWDIPEMLEEFHFGDSLGLTWGDIWKFRKRGITLKSSLGRGNFGGHSWSAITFLAILVEPWQWWSLSVKVDKIYRCCHHFYSRWHNFYSQWWYLQVLFCVYLCKFCHQLQKVSSLWW